MIKTMSLKRPSLPSKKRGEGKLLNLQKYAEKCVLHHSNIFQSCRIHFISRAVNPARLSLVEMNERRFSLMSDDSSWTFGAFQHKTLLNAAS